MERRRNVGGTAVEGEARVREQSDLRSTDATTVPESSRTTGLEATQLPAAKTGPGGSATWGEGLASTQLPGPGAPQPGGVTAAPGLSELAATQLPGGGPASGLEATQLPGDDRPGASSRPVSEHLDGLSGQGILATDATQLSGVGAADGRRGDPQVDAPKVGRYVTIGVLGAGGMGTVLAAYDPKLDRKVAVKLLHGVRRDDAEHRLRMEREAQAMAKLSHPNVVTVYEVGEHGGQMFLAMEFVKGRDLRQWLDSRGAEASWRAVLELFLQAGEGLAAAHRVGIIHRDFKPGNVFVGDDGRVRVGDFGLARQSSAAEEASSGLRRLHSVDDIALSRDLTVSGAAMGTPAYMAPEQFAGAATDARTDQFSFSAALWEALFDQLPFTGETFRELRENVLDGRRAPAPTRKGVPAWLRQVLERGLSHLPEARYPTTDAFLAALRADPRPRRRRLMAGLVGGIAIAGVFAGRGHLEAREVAACEAAGASIGESWNEGAEAKLREGLLATGLAYAPETAERVSPYLSDYAEAWRSARTTACMKARVERTWDPGTLERSVWCLDERRVELEALLRALSSATEGSLVRAVTSAATLERVESCLDPVRLAAMPPPPTDRDAADAVVVMLRDARAVLVGGAVVQALELSERSLASAEALGWPPLLAEARSVHGSALSGAGKHAEAEQALVEAYFAAADAGAWRVAAGAAKRLAQIVGEVQDRVPEGLLWTQHAQLAGAVIGEHGSGLAHAELLEIRAVILGKSGEYEAAMVLLERALLLIERELGVEALPAVSVLSSMAVFHRRLGRREEARELLQRVLLRRREAFGEGHPDVLGTQTNLANLALDMGDNEGARQLYRRVLSAREAMYPSGHNLIGRALANLAVAEANLGEERAAEAHNRRALSIFERTLGPEHPNVAGIGISLAELHEKRGEHAEAEALLERSIAILEGALGPESRFTLEAQLSLAAVLRAAGEYSRARALGERVRGVAEGDDGGVRPLLAEALTLLAGVATDEGRGADGIPLAERAVELRESTSAAPEDLAASRFELARALIVAGGSGGRERALELARQAELTYREREAAATELAAVQAFLGEHRAAAGP